MNLLITVHAIKGLWNLVMIPFNLFISCLKFSYICFAITILLFFISKIKGKNKFLVTISYIIDAFYRISIIILFFSIIITVVFFILFTLSFILFRLMNKLYEISFKNKDKGIFSALASPIATVIGLSFTFMTTLVSDRLFKSGKIIFKQIYEDIDKALDEFSKWKLRNSLPILIIIFDWALQLVFKKYHILKIIDIIVIIIFGIEMLINLINYCKKIHREYKNIVKQFYLIGPIEIKKSSVSTFYPRPTEINKLGVIIFYPSKLTVCKKIKLIKYLLQEN